MEQIPVYYCKKIEVDRFPQHNDAVWDSLPQMQLKETATGDTPGLSTAVAAFWSSQSIYFRFDCEDNYVVATLSNRDDPIYNEDVVEVFLSETSQLTDYKEFELSPTNVQFDAAIRNGLQGKIQVDLEWDAKGWLTSVHIEPGQRRLVYVWEIPFDNFTGGTPAKGDRWLMNCYRIDRGRTVKEDEYSAWSPTGKIDFHIPQKFGYLNFD